MAEVSPWIAKLLDESEKFIQDTRRRRSLANCGIELLLAADAEGGDLAQTYADVQKMWVAAGG
jgi:hypothetical protein